jgi:hypothetical protein
MRENLTFKGIWFLPNSPENYYTGILNYNYKEGFFLEIINGVLSSEKSFNDNKADNIILGVTTDKKLITLYDCFFTSVPVFSTGNSLEISKYVANYMFIGAHFKEISDFTFCSIETSFNKLEEWLSIAGFKLINPEETSGNNFKVDYEQPKEIKFNINPNLNGKFTFPYVVDENLYEKHVFQEANFVLESVLPYEINFKEVLNNIFSFQDFLSIATYNSPIYPKSVILRSNKVKTNFNGIDFFEKIEFYFVSSNNDKDLDQKRIHYWKMLFGYKDIYNNFEDIIKKWYEKNDEMNGILFPVINLISETLNNPHYAIQNKFLNIIQGIETFHRRTRSKTILPENEFKEKLNIIWEKISKEEKDWLCSKIYFPIANELSLEERIKEMFEEFETSTLKNLIPDKDDFIKKTKNSRNYYTHYKEDGKKKALSGVDLLFHTEKLKVLLITSVLGEIGLNLTQIESLLKRNEFSFFNHLIEDENEKN